LKIRMERCRGLEENNFEGFHCVICWITDFRAPVRLFNSRSTYVAYVGKFIGKRPFASLRLKLNASLHQINSHSL
jgi:hypothetical protein